MAYTEKTLLVPNFEQTRVPQQTMIDPKTGMAQGFGTPSLLPLLLSAGSDKPVKNRQVQVTTPYAQNDLIKARDAIGGATTDLASALRGRENWGYALGNILSGIQADSTPGGWLASLARGAGAGLTTMENIKQDTAKQLYDARMQDLAQRLAFDKAMGQTVTTDLNYLPQTNDNNFLLTMLLLGNGGL